MAKEVRVKATSDQWQWVLFFMNNFVFPEKLGEKEYKPIERARIQEEVTAVYDALVPHSYYLQQHGQEYKSYFGEKTDWLDGEDDPKTGKKSAHPGKVYEVAFGERAVSGLLWLFTVLLTPPEMKTDREGNKTPSHPYLLSAPLAARFIWPIVQSMGKVKALRQAVGLVPEPMKVWGDDVEVAG